MFARLEFLRQMKLLISECEFRKVRGQQEAQVRENVFACRVYLLTSVKGAHWLWGSIQKLR
jgi:hypothetical protein